MSFQATHLKFALDVKDIVKAKNLTLYFSGTLYPDSRYLTKIDRKITHTRFEPKEIPRLTDDFVKGWQVHLWYDKLALPYLDLIGLGKKFDPNLDRKNFEVWTKVTAVKLVEDFYYWQHNPWSKILPYLQFTKDPNNEDVNILKSWYHYFASFYAMTPNFSDYTVQAKFMNIPDNLANQTQQNAEEILLDKVKAKKAQKIMGLVKKEFNELISIS